MRTYTGWEYLLIDAANHWGHDKLRFEERIDWALLNIDNLEAMAEERGPWKELPLFLKAVQALRKAEAGIPTGHMVGFDAVCSGMQLMAVLTGCHDSAKATGLVDLDRRADAYTDCTDVMQKVLSKSLTVDRDDVKDCTVPTLYGSTKAADELYGKGTEEANAYTEALFTVAPGPCELLEDLRNSWRPYALEHAWKLPDGGDVRVKVMEKVEKRIEVDELNHSTFTYEYYENVGVKSGLSNIANVIHSVDAYVLRCLVRRCSYDSDSVRYAYDCIQDELIDRAMQADAIDNEPCEEIQYYEEQYNRSGLADIVIVPYITRDNILGLSDTHLQKLSLILEGMLQHKPFDIITVHDDFKCHPNHMNHLRNHYRNILADIADSRLLDDLLSQLYGQPGTFQKKSTDLSKYIRQSNYALA